MSLLSRGRVDTYAAAREYLDGGRDPNRRPAGNNTDVMHRAGGQIAVRLHGTDVVTYGPPTNEHPEGTVTLDSGGWRTATTKDRMNRHTPHGFYVYQEAGTWYIKTPALGEEAYTDGVTLDAATGGVVA